jgi:hypothetical protein
MSVSIVEVAEIPIKERYANDRNLALLYRGSAEKSDIRAVQDVLREMEKYSELEKYFFYISGRITNVYVFLEFLKFRKRNVYKTKKESIEKFIERLDL